MSEMTNKVGKSKQPQFRNIHVLQLANYRLPLAGLVSILHRISGVLIFALLPVILYLLDKSLTSQATFNSFIAIFNHWFVRLIVLALAWAYFHHFSAGVRHLFMDCHFSLDKDSSRKSAAAVLLTSLFLTLLVALKLFGVF